MRIDTPYYRMIRLSKIASKLSTAAREAMVNRFFDAFPPAESAVVTKKIYKSGL